jgi:ribose-phosphate pyrophosphokinase
MLIYAETLRPIKYTAFKFSGGEIQVKLDLNLPVCSEVTIEGNIESSDDLMEVLMLADALRRSYKEIDYRREDLKIHLVCPYLPYARQDRVCDKGEALSLRVFCQIINAANFYSVTVWDAHSDVSLALLDRAYNVPPEVFVEQINLDPNTVLVAPDAGSIKKVAKVAKRLNLDFVRADKTRDVRTGDITDTVVYSNHVGNRDFLILDDLIDGGRSFQELAKKLRPLTYGHVYLYVTHGIFDKGFAPLREIDHIWCANPFKNVDLEDPIITHIGAPIHV